MKYIYITQEKLEAEYSAYVAANEKIRKMFGFGIGVMGRGRDLSCWEFMNWKGWRVI